MALDGTRVLVVGGTSGLGLSVAAAAAERGATPIVASRRQESVDRALGTLPSGALGATVDLTDPDSIDRLIGYAAPIDHLVYTAGEPLRITMMPDLTPDTVRRFWETRFVGALSVIRAASMAGAIRASVVLTGGNASQRSAPGWALGASVCGAIEALVRQLALELAPIRVNAVAPGITRSPLWSGMSPDQEEAMYADLASRLPVGRVGEPSDVALSYIYAMEQRMTTGTSILVDGGAVLV
ncbi:SDR family oxidoreductase [Asanoa iriomotensis]|uniref:Short-chain dehydrogenase n=1 Tax=Asanoa iriomotensis TaxID=234613 RepID=A0ABQ4CBP2_9ACTN|nr:SDR family oxidoreductase [Asanoa iriomotensis]GIF60187.1 short-chain dehydrogenase [Asanoa iriomotensis]